MDSPAARAARPVQGSGHTSFIDEDNVPRPQRVPGVAGTGHPVLVEELVHVLGSQPELGAQDLSCLRARRKRHNSACMEPADDHACANARIAVVLPEPAGPIPTASRAFEVANASTSERCPASSVMPVRESSMASDASRTVSSTRVRRCCVRPSPGGPRPGVPRWW